MRHCSAITDDLRSRPSRRALLPALLAGLAAVSTGCDTIPAISHQAVLTSEEQSGIGAIAASELMSTSKRSQDQQQIMLTDAVGQRLADASGRNDIDWNFRVVAHTRPIAVALPEGTVLVTEGLVTRCRSEAELAAVLSREMGCMLAGLYPDEVLSPYAGMGYMPLTIDALTPADQSAKRAEDLEAADSIGLSMLVRAGYDPAAAAAVWLKKPDGFRPDVATAHVSARRQHERRSQSFKKSLEQAGAVYQHSTAKLGTGRELAFAPPVSVAPPKQVEPAALEWVAPPTLSAPPVKTAAAAPALTLPGSNQVAVSSDGEFLPPTVAAAPSAAGNWSAAAEPAETSGIEQTSFELPNGPALP